MLGDDFDATVTGVTGQGAFLQLDKYLVDGFVALDDLPGDRSDRWRLNRTTGALVAQRSGRTITIGDRFTARIANVDLGRREMELVIVENHSSKNKRNQKKTAANKAKSRGKRRQPEGARKAHQKSNTIKKRRNQKKNRRR